MSREEIVQKLLTYFRETYPHDGRTLDEDTDLLNDWFVDSLGIVMTVVFLEENFGVDIGRADVNIHNFSSAGALADFVLRRL